MVGRLGVITVDVEPVASEFAIQVGQQMVELRRDQEELALVGDLKRARQVVTQLQEMRHVHVAVITLSRDGGARLGLLRTPMNPLHARGAARRIYLDTFAGDVLVIR